MLVVVDGEELGERAQVALARVDKAVLGDAEEEVRAFLEEEDLVGEHDRLLEREQQHLEALLVVVGWNEQLLRYLHEALLALHVGSHDRGVSPSSVLCGRRG